MANGLNSIARVEQLLGDYVAAERDYCEALRIAKLVNYHEGIPSYLGNLAGLALVQENWPVAEQFAREALPLAEQVGKQESIAHQCQRLAKSLAQQGCRVEGFAYAQRAVSIYAKLRSPHLAEAQAVLKECEESSPPNPSPDLTSINQKKG